MLKLCQDETKFHPDIKKAAGPKAGGVSGACLFGGQSFSFYGHSDLVALVYLLLRAGQGDDGVQDGNGYELAGPGSGDVAEVVAAEDAGDDLDVEIFGKGRICRADDADDLYAALLGVAGVLQDVPGAAGVHDDEQQVVLVHHADLHGLEDEVLYAAAGYGEL